MTHRVALISEHASPLADLGSVDSGGQNVYVAQVALHLARQGNVVDIFTRRDNPALPEIMEWKEGVRVIHVPAGPAKVVRKEKLLPYMQAFSDYMIYFCQREGEFYNLVHANFWMSALVAANLKKALGIPFVVTFHALGKVRRQHQGQEDGFPDERFTIEERVVREADRIIAECPQDKADLRLLYQADPAKVAVIPCGFDPNEIWPVDKDQARKAVGLPQDEFIVLQLGRMVPRKGVETVVRGFARLVKGNDIRARLVIVGGETKDPDPLKTPEIGRLQKIAQEEGVDERVTFTGRRGREAIKHYYSAADVFVSTPWYEPFGITPVEAMACGTPVIGSRVGGIKYSVRDGETGYLIPPKDPEALAERLDYLFHNPKELQRLSQKALKRANTLFTWQKVAALIGSLYEEIVDHPPAIISPVEAGAASPMEIVNQCFAEAVETLQFAQLALSEQTLKAAGAIVDCLIQGGKVMVCGNGGSAADSQHFAGELVGRFKQPGRSGLPVMALTADTAFLTAWANDVDYEDVFARQVEAFGHPGDLLVGLSTTGRSRNLIKAFAVARRRKISCLALLGGDGGELGRLADLALIVPSRNTPRVQEVQLLILHLLCELVERHFVPGEFTLADFISRQRYIYPSLFGSVAAEAQPPWDMQSTDLQSAVISVKANTDERRKRPPTNDREPLGGKTGIPKKVVRSKDR